MVLKFKLNNEEDGIVITGGENVRDKLVVPQKLQHRGEEYPVIAIEDSAFCECKDLTSVIIPNTVTKIGDYAFCQCPNLDPVNIPDSVKELGKCAFSGCSSLTSIVIPDSVTEIDDFTFYGCSKLTHIDLPDSVIEIGYGTFLGCESLTSILIPNSVTKIGECAFRSCTKLVSVVIPDSVTEIGKNAFLHCPQLQNVVVNDRSLLEKIGALAMRFNLNDKQNGLIFTGGENLEGEVVVPSKHEFEGKTLPVTEIGGYAFSNCFGLTSVVIPDSVTRINDSAFHRCSGLTSVIIPDSVTEIRSGAFLGCSSLTSIVIPDSVTKIGNNPFGGCSGLDSLVVSPRNTEYDSRNNCNAIIETETNTLLVGCQSTIIPDSVIEIGDSAFENCKGLESIVIPGSVTKLGEGAFWGCEGLTSIVIPDSVTEIEKSVFCGCSSLTTVVIPNSVTKIGVGAFTDCSGLTSIDIPNSVTEIGDSAFENCEGLESIVIPDSVTTIGETAFRKCSSLTSILIPRSVNIIGKEPFSRCFRLSTMVVDQNNKYYDSRHNCNAIIETATNTLIAGCSTSTVPLFVKTIGSQEFKEELTIRKNSDICRYKRPSGTIIPKLKNNPNRESLYGCSIMDLIVGEWMIVSKVVVGDSWWYYDEAGVFSFGCKWNFTVTPYLDEKPHADGFYKFDGRIFVDGFYPSLEYAVDENGYLTIKAAGYYDTKAEFRIEEISPKHLVVSGIIAEIIDFDEYLADSEMHVKIVLQKCIKTDEKMITELLIGSWNVVSYESCINTDKTEGDKWLFTKDGYMLGTTFSLNSNNLNTFFIKDKYLKITQLDEAGFFYEDSLTFVVTELSSEKMVLWLKEGKNSYYKTVKLIKDFSVLLNGDMTIKNGVAVIPNSTTSIGEKAFLNCINLKTVVIPNSVKEIGKSAFEGCSNLVFVDIPDTVKRIGNRTFNHCSSLASITIPNSVFEIGDYAFSGCSELVSIIIPNSVVQIGNGAFSSCLKLESIVISDSVIEIGAYAFCDCKRLFDITIPKSVTKIGNNAFCNCSSLAAIDLSNSLTEICANVFQGCSELAFVELPISVTRINDRAFKYCSSLTSIFIPRSVNEIGKEVFAWCSKLSSMRVDVNNKHYDSRNDCNAIIETATNTLVAGCSTSVVPDSVTAIGCELFKKELAIREYLGQDNSLAHNSKNKLDQDELMDLIIGDWIIVLSLGDGDYYWIYSNEELFSPGRRWKFERKQSELDEPAKFEGCLFLEYDATTFDVDGLGNLTIDNMNDSRAMANFKIEKISSDYLIVFGTISERFIYDDYVHDDCDDEYTGSVDSLITVKIVMEKTRQETETPSTQVKHPYTKKDRGKISMFIKKVLSLFKQQLTNFKGF